MWGQLPVLGQTWTCRVRTWEVALSALELRTHSDTPDDDRDHSAHRVMETGTWLSSNPFWTLAPRKVGQLAGTADTYN